jgi:hypothetical protein
MEEDLFTPENIGMFKRMALYEKARISMSGPPKTAIDKLLSSLIINWRTLYEMERLIKKDQAKLKQQELGDEHDDQLIRGYLAKAK